MDNIRIDSRWPFLIVGFGLLLSAIQVGEVLFAPTQSVPYILGFLTGIPFLVGLIYGGMWLARSGIPSARYHRIGLWFLGGVIVFAIFIIPIALATTPAEQRSTLLVVSTVRWTVGLGGSIGLGTGILEARAIEREREAERLSARQTLLRLERDRLDEFASIVSHDLRNPLNVAQVRLELAQSECESDHHEPIGRSLDRMETIIEDTLALARHGQRVADRDHIDLEEVAHGCWDVIEQGDAILKIEETGTLLADRTRIEHIFENLYRNAIEHAGDDVTIRVGVLANGDGFYVVDDGPGIPGEEREKVFEWGYTNDEDGTGIGLTIVRVIAEAHGWEVRITDGEAGGARFEFTNVEIEPQRLRVSPREVECSGSTRI